MAIQFPCSHCEKMLSAAEDAVGRPVMCLHCGKVTHVPDPSLLLNSSSAEDPFSTNSSSQADLVPPGEMGEILPMGNVRIVHEEKLPITLRQIESQTGWAIIVSLCFMPLAIVGMIFGSMAKAEFQAGNYAVAERYYKRARTWTTLALCLWICIFVILVFFIILPAMASLPK